MWVFQKNPDQLGRRFLFWLLNALLMWRFKAHQEKIKHKDHSSTAVRWRVLASEWIKRPKMQGMHFFFCFLCKRYELSGRPIQAHCLHCKMKCTDKDNHMKSRSVALSRSADGSERRAAALRMHLFSQREEGASFTRRGAFLLCSSGVRLLRWWRCSRFLGVLFGCGLWRGRGGGGRRLSGFGALRGLWGSVGRMSPAPPFVPGRGRAASPPASLLSSHRGLRTQTHTPFTHLWPGSFSPEQLNRG